MYRQYISTHAFIPFCGACFCRPMVRNFRRPFRNWDIVDGILLCGKSAGFFSIRVFVYNSRLGAGWPDELRFDKRMSLPRGFTWERAAKEVKSSCASHTVRCREPTVKLWVYATLAFGAGQMPLDQQSGHIRSHWLVLILSMLVQFRFIWCQNVLIISSCMRALHHPVVSSIDIVIVTVSNNQMQKSDEFCPNKSACRLVCITHNIEYLLMTWVDVDLLSIFCTPRESIHFQTNMIEYAFPSVRILGFWSCGMRPKKHWHVLWFSTLIVEACGNIMDHFNLLSMYVWYLSKELGTESRWQAIQRDTRCLRYAAEQIRPSAQKRRPSSQSKAYQVQWDWQRWSWWYKACIVCIDGTWMLL